MNEIIFHTLPPIYYQNSQILILGTMPSPKSREIGFYYGHPQNRFWSILSVILNDKKPESNEERTQFLFSHHIALWDVLQSCRINGADDSSIRDPVVNPIENLLTQTNVKKVFTTGQKAFKLYNRYCLQLTGMEAIALPSSSPANCRQYTFEKLCECYRQILVYLDSK